MKRNKEIKNEDRKLKSEILGFLVFMTTAYSATATLNSFSIWNFDILHYIFLQIISAIFYISYKLYGNKLRLEGPSKVELIEEKEMPEEWKKISEKVEKSNKQITEKEVKKDIEKPIKKLYEAPVHRFTLELEELYSQFLTETKKSTLIQPEIWETIVNLTYPMNLTVQRHKKLAHCYTLNTTFDNTPAAVFDAFNSNSNSNQSPYMECQEDIEILDANTAILYICTKSIWPTSARDLCCIKSSKALDDGSIVTVFKSIQHERRKENFKLNVVRMEIFCAGIKFQKHGEKECKMTLHFHGDPKGWVPKSLITFIASNILPSTFEKVNKKVRSLPAKKNSTILVDYNKLNMEDQDEIGESSPSLENLSNKTETQPEVIISQQANGKVHILEGLVTESTSIESKIDPSLIPTSSVHLGENFGTTRSNNHKSSVLPLVPTKPSFWERLKAKFLPSSILKRIISTTAPVLLIAALFAILAKRNRIGL